jgi:hypothetical protein
MSIREYEPDFIDIKVYADQNQNMTIKFLPRGYPKYNSSFSFSIEELSRELSTKRSKKLEPRVITFFKACHQILGLLSRQGDIEDRIKDPKYKLGLDLLNKEMSQFTELKDFLYPKFDCEMISSLEIIDDTTFEIHNWNAVYHKEMDQALLVIGMRMENNIEQIYVLTDEEDHKFYAISCTKDRIRSYPIESKKWEGDKILSKKECITFLSTMDGDNKGLGERLYQKALEFQKELEKCERITDRELYKFFNIK